MHDEQREECIIHESIVNSELTDLHHDSVIFGNKSDVQSIDLVCSFCQKINNRDFVFCLLVEWVPLNYCAHFQS